MTLLVFSIAILLYGFVLARLIPERFHFIANLLAAAISIVAGLAVGLSLEAMGMGLHVIGTGIIVAGLVSVGIIAGVFITASIPPLKRYFVHAQAMEPNRVAYETAVRIPLSTALTEEILFRGVLLGLLLASHGTVVAVAICSLVFGIWHIFPSLDRLRLHADDTHSTVALKTLYVAATIGTTACAGVFFSWLRLLAGSIIAPWLTHWSINASAMLASAYIAHRNKGMSSKKGRQA